MNYTVQLSCTTSEQIRTAILRRARIDFDWRRSFSVGMNHLPREKQPNRFSKHVMAEAVGNKQLAQSA